jgi:SAM-dependent methyltransferase
MGMTELDASDRGYIFEGSGVADALFGRRTAAQDVAFLLPYVRPGVSIVDCGCGPGSISIGLARLIVPGEVVGFDISATAIASAKRLAAERDVQNVRFEVASVYEPPPLPEASFDVALFSNVLAHLEEPARALALAYRLLKPGGILAACDPYKAGDWFAGPHAEAAQRLNEIFIASMRARGGDPMMGVKLPEALAEGGFGHVQVAPGVAPSISSAQALSQLFARMFEDKHFSELVIGLGLTTDVELRGLTEEVQLWAASESALVAFAECRALAWKPE